MIVIQPFSQWKYKEWGMKKFAALVSWIRSEYRFPVILTGSHGEREKADEIKTMSGESTFNFAGKTSIGMFAALLKSCNMFIGGDSAGIHISAAVGTPTVSIFGPASPSVWAPRGEQHAVVYNRKRPCVPCDSKGCEGRGISRCLEELTVDDVKSVVRHQIDNNLCNRNQFAF